MKTKLMLLEAGAAAMSALILSATPANAAGPRSLALKDVSGAVRVEQALPCGNRLNLDTSIVRGYMQVTWSEVTRGEVLIDLTHLNMLVAPFQMEGNCSGVRASVDFREIGVQLASAVKVRAESALDTGLIYFTIPKERFLLYESVLNDAPVRQPYTSYQRPSADVTGVIDVRRQTVQLNLALTNELRFRAGCDGDRCVIDETHTGTITSDIRARNLVKPATASGIASRR
jgi:hypothetical protein